MTQGVKIPVGIDDANFKRGLAKVKQSLGRFSTDVRSKANAWAKYSAVATGAMAATTAAIYKARSQSIDSLAKTADALAITTEKLQALNHVAELNGVSSEQMAKGLQRMERGLGEAARKGGTAADALADVGVNLDEILSLDPDQQIQVLANALGKVDNQAMRASIASDLFGRDGVRMLKVLTQLRKEGVEPTAAKLAELGISINRIDAAKVEAANDAFFEARQVIEGAGNALTVKLAPFVKEVSEQFTKAARESNGFGDEIQAAIERGMRVAGKFGDVLQGLRVVFKGLELVGVGFGAAVISSFQLAAEALIKFRDASTKVTNQIIEQLNKIPGVDIAQQDMWTDSAFMQGLRSLGDASRDQVGALREELHALAMQELPSDKIEAYLQNVSKLSSEMAAKVASDIQSVTSGNDDDEGAGVDDAFTKRLEAIRNRFKTEEELKREHLAVMADIERAWRENKFETDAEYYATKEMAERDHEQRLKAIKEQAEAARNRVGFAANAAQLKNMASTLDQAGSLMESNGKKSFERTKKASLASAIASLPSAVIQSFQNGGGYPWGLVPAGAMLKTGLDNINKIKGSSYGGGGAAAASASGGASQSAPSAPQSPQGGGRLVVEGLSTGSLFDGETVRQLAERLSEHTKNGGTIAYA